MNLDADNIMSEPWLELLPSMVVADNQSVGTGCWRFKGQDGGCTGRIAVLDTVFTACNGYDEGFPHPCGSQDIEFSRRAQFVANQTAKEVVVKRPLCGYSIPNDDDRKVAVGWAKTKNTTPEARTVKWHQMNNVNWQYCTNLERDGRRSIANLGQAMLGKPHQVLQPSFTTTTEPRINWTPAPSQPASSAAATVSSAPLPAATVSSRLSGTAWLDEGARETPRRALTWGAVAPHETSPAWPLPSPPQPLRVRFVTLGAKHMVWLATQQEGGSHNVPNCWEVQERAVQQARGMRQPIPDVLMRRACIEVGIVRRHDFTLLLDCRPFHDPAAHRDHLVEHVGSHATHVERLVNHRKFGRWLETLKLGWERALSEAAAGSTVVIVCYCAAGRHRSVACALIASHLFEVTTGMPVPETVDHACRHHWARLCGPQCQWCTGQHEVRDAALKKAREQWGLTMVSGATASRYVAV